MRQTGQNFPVCSKRMVIKMKIGIRALSIFLAITLALEIVPSKVTMAEAESANVFTVTVMDEGNPVAGADVHCYDGDNKIKTDTVVTDSNGAAAFPEISSANIPSDDIFYFEVRMEKDSNYFLLSKELSKGTTENMVFNLKKQASGKICNKDDPVAGAEIKIGALTVKSGTDGTFSLYVYNYANVKQTIQVFDSDYYQPYTGDLIVDSGNNITLKAKTPNSGFSFQTPYPSQITYTADGCFQNTASGGKGSGAITYAVTDGNAASVNPSTGELTLLRAGTVTVTAVKAADDTYAKATASYTLTIQHAQDNGFAFQTPNPSDVSFSNGTYQNVASGGNGTGTISYAISKGDAASVNSATGKLTFLHIGTVTVTATRAEDDTYDEVTAEYNLTITPAQDSGFSFQKPGAAAITYRDGGTYQNIASGGNSKGKVTYAITGGDQDAASIDSSTGIVTTLYSGKVIVTATREADNKYAKSTAQYELNIQRATDSGFTFETPKPADVTYSKETYHNKAAGGKGQGVVSYGIIKGNAASIDPMNGDLTILHSGTVTIRAIRAQDRRYNSIQTEYTITFIKANQSISFMDAGPFSICYGNSFKNQAIEQIAGFGTGKFEYSVIRGSDIASVNEQGELLFNNQKTGTMMVQAVEVGDDCYNPSQPVTYSVTVNYLDVPETPYSLSGEKRNNSGWYTGDVTIKAKDGYQICFSNDLTNQSWSSSLVVSCEGKNEQTVYLRRLALNGSGYDVTDSIVINAEDLQIDKSNPENLSVSYSVSLRDQIIEALTFGYYNPSVTVTLTATDTISHIDSFNWTYTQQAGSSKLNTVKQNETITSDHITYSDGDKTAAASFTLTASEAEQYRGNISFIATDKAGRASDYADGKVIVVDNVAPQVTISYNCDGKLVRKVKNDPSCADAQPNDIDVRYIYTGRMKATISVNEANFVANDVNISICKNGQATDDYALSGWASSGDINTEDILFSKDGTYTLNITYKDESNNQMQYKSESENKAGVYSYTSNVFTIDNTAPKISVVYDKNDAKSNANCYNTNRRAEITVNDLDFRPMEIVAHLKAIDIQGNNISSFDASGIETALKNWNSWTQISPSVWRASIAYDADAIYTFDIDYSDMAGNCAADYPGDTFEIDKSAPDASSFAISYSTPVLQMIIQSVSFGFYNPSVTVTVKADDAVSGVDRFIWTYTKEQGTSSVNLASETNIIDAPNIVYSNGKKTAQAEFILTADQARQYRGKISFSATDKAGNTSSVKSDDGSILVVDTVSPTRTVVYSPAKQVVDASTMLTRSDYCYSSEGTNSILYYDSEATITFKINEANFFSQNVKIKVNGAEKAPTIWSNSGDDWTSSITLKDDGEYVVTMDYTDNSHNEMKSYTSDKIVIDTANPVMNVHYNSVGKHLETNGRKYCNEPQTAAITITEHNFRADDVAAVITAKDVSGTNVPVTDFSNYLKKRNSWTKSGDNYTAIITLSADANYTFDLSYKDLAGRSASAYKQDKFTIDKTVPNHLYMSYSKNVFETVLESITFGYYNAPMQVVISAEDDTSGIDHFIYNYSKDEGVSPVNAELLNQAIQNAGINFANGGKTAQTRFTIPKNSLTDVTQFRGMVDFSATDRSGNSTFKKGNEQIIIDNIAPNAKITFNKPVNVFNGISYYSGDVTALIDIKEANFYPEDVSVSISKNSAAVLQSTTNWKQNGDNWTKTITLHEDGNYFIKISYKDRSGNKMADYQSNQITIDTKKPEITVTGIRNNSANKDHQIGFTVTANDINLDPAEFRPVLSEVLRKNDGTFESKNILLGDLKTLISGKEYSYSIDNLSSDGVYSLVCSVKDKSGNYSDAIMANNSEGAPLKKLDFSVNRNGSTFTLDKNTITLASKYYIQNVKSDLTISEIDTDPLSEYQIKLNNKTLTKGVDYSVVRSGGNDSWNKYTYNIKSQLFQKEGIYSVVVNSVDKAGTTEYNDIKKAKVEFDVDRTAPEITASGIEENGRYQVQKQIVTIIPQDDGGKLQSVKVTILDAKGKIISNPIELSGDKLIDKLENNSSKLEFNIQDGMYQTVNIACSDFAGNKYNGIFKNITVSASWYIIFWANTTLRYGSIIGILFLTMGIAMPLVRRKRKKFKRRKL